MKKILISMLIIMLIFCSGCSAFEKKACGDFTYIVVKIDDEGKTIKGNAKNRSCVETYINIIGLSRRGKQQEVVIVPQFINGLEVKQVGNHYFQNIGGTWKSRTLKKVFIPFQINIEHFYGLGEGVKNIYLSDRYDTAHDGSHIYITSLRLEGDDGYTSGGVRFSNVSYMYNYNGAPNNGYYWVDDCDYGTPISYIPKNPEREGYDFGGWYKEADCINEWDFGVDNLPNAIYGEYGKLIYQETILFAKWIEE